MTQSSKEQLLKDIISDSHRVDQQDAGHYRRDEERVLQGAGQRAHLRNCSEGASKINSMMRTCVVKSTEAAGIDDPDNSNLLNSFAEFYRSQGQYAKAEPLLYVACLEQRRIALGRPVLILSNRRITWWLYFHNIALLKIENGHVIHRDESIRMS